MDRRSAVIVEWHEPVLRLYHVADAHVGSAACNEAAIGKLAGIIAADPMARVIGGGDYTESIAPSDRRFDPSELAGPIEAEQLTNLFYCQAMRFAHLFLSTKGKWDGVIAGNHEVKATQFYYCDPTAIIAEHLGARYVGGTDQCGWFVYRMMRNGRTRATVRVFVSHGWGGGELRGGDALKLQRICWRKSADIVLLAHVHRPMAFPETVEVVSNKGVIKTQTRWGVIGFPLCGGHGYAARKAGNAPAPGYTQIEIRLARGSERTGPGRTIAIKHFEL